MGKHKSIIYQLSDGEFIELVKKIKSYSELLSYFLLENKGNNHKTVKRRIKELNIDTSHFLTRLQSSSYSRRMTKDKLINYLTEKSNISRHHLKSYLIKYNLINYICNICKNDGNWNNKKLSLQLEHINGVSNDNRLENLCFLCPNCHSQTDTFAGKKLKTINKIQFCKQCNNIKNLKYSSFCKECIIKNFENQTNYSLENILKLISEIPITEICKKLNVSHKSLLKFFKKINIDYKTLSPFSKQNNIKKCKPKIKKIYSSKYKHVYFNNTRKKWIANIKNEYKINLLFKRCDTELEAAQAIATFLNNSYLIER